MAKKFFYNRVYNTKRTVINISIIVVCVIGIILCFVLTTNFQNEGDNNTPMGNLNIKTETTVEINEQYNNEIFFSKIENFDINNIKITYPTDFDISKVGTYPVTLNIEGKDYVSNLIVVDTKKPNLEVKNVTITEGSNYFAKDFVTSCTDNSKKDCKISFYDGGINQDGEKVTYDKYNKAGIYAIKIVASDDSGNENIKETQLTINKNNNAPEQQVVTCKYGNNLYDKASSLVSVDITSNNCAVSLDLYKDSTMITEVYKMLEPETTRIKKDVEALKLAGKFTLNRKITAIGNITGNGIVGYEIQINVTITNNDKSEKIVEYKLNTDGKRVFTLNQYNLPE